MSWKRTAIEAVTWAVARAFPVRRTVTWPPKSLFVLRNNDIGDLLVVTPLFDALRRRFPEASIVVGVGAWNREVLVGNPHVSEIAVVSAPWYNRVNGSRDPRVILRYIIQSPEAVALTHRRFDVGIDVLGSAFGSWLLMRAGIPLRLGVRGYAGGHTAAQRHVEFNDREHVGRAALRFSELLGAVDLPDTRPQLFISPAEVDAAEQLWTRDGGPDRQRVVIAPGGGYPGRRWPLEHFVELARRLCCDTNISMLTIGGNDDRAAAERIAAVAPSARDVTGQLTLRQTFGAIARANLVFCNSSMAMHAAAAFDVPAVVLLGPHYDSAAAHAEQWGHGDLSLVLGRGANRADIYGPDEALSVASRHRPVAATRVLVPS